MQKYLFIKKPSAYIATSANFCSKIFTLWDAISILLILLPHLRSKNTILWPECALRTVRHTMLSKWLFWRIPLPPDASGIKSREVEIHVTVCNYMCYVRGRRPRARQQARFLHVRSRGGVVMQDKSATWYLIPIWALVFMFHIIILLARSVGCRDFHRVELQKKTSLNEDDCDWKHIYF